jgi:hypothetical protein
MPSDDRIKAAGKRAGRNAVALAVAALLANSSAPAQSTLGAIVEQAKQLSSQSTAKATPPLVIGPSSNAIQFDHASHASHSSHYSSSTGGGDDTTGNDNPGGGGSQNNPAPQPPATPAPSPASPPQPVETPKEQPDTWYPFIVDMNDGREIRCDVQEDGDYYDLIKKSYTIRVLKTDVKSFERVAQPTTQPTTDPSAAPPTTQPGP